MSDTRYWIDGIFRNRLFIYIVVICSYANSQGCFDFMHHGHHGAVVQAKKMCETLVAGVHSDEDIRYNKGPPVMSLRERAASLGACKWVDEVVLDAPYNTSLEWLDYYGCKYVVHGDDISTNASGVDAYDAVKKANRMRICKRTENISTTDLVDRILNTKSHHWGKGDERWFTDSTRKMVQRYATGPDGKDQVVPVWLYKDGTGEFESIMPGKGPEPDQKIVYVDGGWDFMTIGHLRFLDKVAELGNTYIVVGVHADRDINKVKGGNYPVMNDFERAMTVCSNRHTSALILNAPLVPNESFLKSLPFTSSSSLLLEEEDNMAAAVTVIEKGNCENNAYKDAKRLGIYRQIQQTDEEDVSSEDIVRRVLDRKEEFLDRQKRKQSKSDAEKVLE